MLEGIAIPFDVVPENDITKVFDRDIDRERGIAGVFIFLVV